MYYCGIDVAKRNHEACLITENGEVIGKTLNFPNSEDGCKKLLVKFEESQILPENLVIGMESTGHYWLALHQFLIENGFLVKVVNPIQSEAFRKISIRKVKTDSKDSLTIAQLMRFGNYSYSKMSSENIASLRILTCFRLSLNKEIRNYKRKIICILDQIFPEYENLFTDIFGQTSKEILVNFPTPEELANVNTRKLTNLISKAGKGHFGLEKAREIKDCAKNSFGVKTSIEAYKIELQMSIDSIIFAENKIVELDEKISVFLKNCNTFITLIPGIGENLGAVIVSEIGDIERFNAPNKLYAFAGLDVRINQSGEFCGTANKISKRGSPYLRRAIWLTAQVAAFKDPILSQYYQSLRERGKHHNVAVNAVCRKLCNIIFVILKENRPYLPYPPKSKNFPKTSLAC